MSEVNLAALAESGNDRVEAKAPTPMQEFNEALRACGFGLFHIRVLITTFVGYISGAMVSNTTSFLLPSAECDLSMDLVQKGLLNAMPYIGMLFSSVLAGFLVDTFGRKSFIMLGLGGSCICTIVSGSSQTYELLIAAKFFDGVLFATFFSAAVTLSAEFCHNGIRDRVLMVQASFISIGQIIVAGLSWAILPNDWQVELFDGRFVLNTWNFYIYVTALWSVVACLMYTLVPESPKYLVAQKKYSEARDILVKIYKMNTRQPDESYPYKDIWKKQMDKVSEMPENQVKDNIYHQIVVGLHNIKPIYKKPLLFYMLLICTMNFITMAVYNIFRLWFPQVSTIVEHNNFTTPDGITQNLCGMLDAYTSKLPQLFTGAHITAECITTKSGAATYISSIVIGAVCIIPYFFSAILVNKIGKKPMITLGSAIGCAATVGIPWANSKGAVVSLFAADIAITQNMMSLNQAIVIEFFPTTTRQMFDIPSEFSCNRLFTAHTHNGVGCGNIIVTHGNGGTSVFEIDLENVCKEN